VCVQGLVRLLRCAAVEKVCPQCGRRFADLDEFCPFDGARLQLVSGAEVGVADTDDVIGTLLDKRYRIERRLGEGGMGVVYLARHVVIEKAVAIKLLKPSVSRDHQVVQRFVQEARAASRIGHPNIADVSDFGTTPAGVAYSVMEYVEGNTLGTAIDKRGRLPMSDSIDIALQIAKALDAAHAKGIVHRDLKPDNIFLVDRAGKKNTVKIVDFGIAKVTPITGGTTARPRMTQAGTVFGTPEYMAPEQALGRIDTDHRVDIYALGVIVFEMLTGQVPLRRDSIMSTLEAQIAEPPPSPRSVAPAAGISEALEQVILRCLAKEADQRVPSMRELAQLLREASQESGAIPAVSAPQYAVATPDASTLVPESQRLAETLAEGNHRSPTQVPPGAPPPRPRPGDPQFASGAGRLRRFDNLDPSSPDTENLRPSKYRYRWTFAAAIFATFAVGLAMFFITIPDPETGVRPTILLDAGVLGAGDRAPSAAGESAVLDGDGEDPGVASEAAPAAEPASDPSDVGPQRKKPRAEGTQRSRDTAAPRAAAKPPPAVRERRRGTGRPHSIVVETRPHGGTLYMPGGSYGGTDGTMVTRPRGTEIEVACSLPGHAVGRVTLSFDGNRELAICRMERKPRCLPGVKNPFDDCVAD